ncbi:uncharacterized protein A4U43_C04F33150 [Asparagus officinalis]|uniref:Uncharacterized protein n=1 Tax=Asparagus officinalis TaxID=4686 RepID=A0A5P1F778_ASPOF|nr:uncharacterized protein A4U43_C04F33150 [Asparagus officinalis]
MMSGLRRQREDMMMTRSEVEGGFNLRLEIDGDGVSGSGLVGEGSGRRSSVGALSTEKELAGGRRWSSRVGRCEGWVRATAWTRADLEPGSDLRSWMWLCGDRSEAREAEVAEQEAWR